ncbi:DNA helicase [Amanita muscaria]
MSSLPQNNLQEVLRRKAINSQPSLTQSYSPVQALQKQKSKFKPATIISPTPSSQSVSAPLAVGSQHYAIGHASSSRNVIVNNSCTAVPATPISTAVKRGSPDYFVNSDSSPQSPKRLKKDTTNKENVLSSGSNLSHKAKTRIEGQTPVECTDSDIEICTTPRPSSERNPFAKLNKEVSDVSPTTKPEGINEHADLLGKSNDTLHKLFRHNQELQHSVTDAVLRYYSNLSDDVDIVILERIRNIMSDRIKNITEVLDSRKNTAAPQQGSVRIDRVTTNSCTIVPTSLNVDVVAPALEILPKIPPSTTSTTVTNYNVTATNYNLEIDLTPDVPDEWEILDEVHQPKKKERDPRHSPHYEEVIRKLRGVFKLTSFRENQLEAVVRALEGRDVLILMPTGGGKSLCYQLPAICDGGKTRGVTVVISPLLALMNDQVDSLKRKEIDVVQWSSETTNNEAKQRLSSPSKPRLLYITPEKLKGSNVTRSIITQLYNTNNLARFVIDEAHVITTWGQDFRDAYRDLIDLRVQYPNVPIMALTATANHATVDDIKKRLQLRNCVFLKSSFNRKNLIYTITNKRQTTVLMDIIKYIKEKHANKTGIIYCLARKTCEKVAKKLREGGLIARHYHAGITAEEKDTALSEWRLGRCSIIVATIAFGMGIDKADVRFVIHHDLPKSLDGYYQETGRAGRDGKPADCLLYYSFSDFFPLKSIIEKGQDGQPFQQRQGTIDRQLSEVRKVVAYCSNLSDCRRVQLLQFFGEKFDKTECGSKCDNCSYGGPVEQKDLTPIAITAVQVVGTLRQRKENITLDMCKCILSGSKANNVVSRGFDNLPAHGSAHDLPREQIELMLQRLVSLDILTHFSVEHGNGFHSSYVELGPLAQDLLSKKLTVAIDWRPRESKSRKANQQAPRRVENAELRRPENQNVRPNAEDAIEAFEEDYGPFHDEVEDVDIDPLNDFIDPEKIYTGLCDLRMTVSIPAPICSRLVLHPCAHL